MNLLCRFLRGIQFEVEFLTIGGWWAKLTCPTIAPNWAEFISPVVYGRAPDSLQSVHKQWWRNHKNKNINKIMNKEQKIKANIFIKTHRHVLE